MFRRTVTQDDLAQLKRRREAADRAYNQALSALDEALLTPRDLPHPPPPFDDFQVSPLNAGWQLVGPDGPDLGGGWRQRLNGLVWRFVGPMIQRQQAFNANVVDHVNRNVATSRETQKAATSVIALLRDELDALHDFQSRLVQYLQRITPFVDAKDYEFNGLARRVAEDAAALAHDLDRRTRGIIGALDGATNEQRMRAESAVAREQRFTQHVEELRTTVGQLQHGLLTIRTELERPGADQATGSDNGGRAATLDRALDAYTYVGFENLFRGAQEEIRARLTDYVPLFRGAGEVLDLGCGRGEFLDLLREAGVSASGLDVNSEMVEECRTRGLEATVGDALSYLTTLPDGALGGLFAAQVIEHLEPAYLIRLLAVAFRKLRPGSTIVLETINPACWFAFFDGYIRDITHVRPLHPDTLQYLLAASGFQRTTIRYSAPYPEDGKLRHAEAPSAAAGAPDNGLAAALSVVNANADKLNQLLFTHLDYAAVGERLSPLDHA